MSSNIPIEWRPLTVQVSLEHRNAYEHLFSQAEYPSYIQFDNDSIWVWDPAQSKLICLRDQYGHLTTEGKKWEPLPVCKFYFPKLSPNDTLPDQYPYHEPQHFGACANPGIATVNCRYENSEESYGTGQCQCGGYAKPQAESQPVSFLRNLVQSARK